MNNPLLTGTDDNQVRQLLVRWALATREGRLDQVLEHHAPDVISRP